METMERKKRPRPRRSFTPEFKAEIVELCRQGDRSDRPGGQGLRLGETAVRTWVHQAEIDAGERAGLTTEERAELIRLRRENCRLREDVGLAEASDSFLREGDPVNVDPFIEAEKGAGHSVNLAVGCWRSPEPPTTSDETARPRSAR